MKAEKKQVGTKAKIRVLKERERRLATAVFLALILFIAAISVYFAYAFLNQPQDQATNPTINPTSLQLRAAIVDQLTLTFPNHTFIQTAENTLKQAGYSVDYYSGEKVTVELYRNLATHGYKIVILRVHSAAGKCNGKQITSLFSSEIYSSTRYTYEQLTDQVGNIGYSVNDTVAYFGISQEFVGSSMNGRFQNSIIIMMGCNGLASVEMAEAFVEKGAKAYIGWNGSVSASHTDQAATCVLKHLITQEETVKEAVADTVKEVGSDPVYNSVLTCYPHEAE